jgi:hypothetical protein
MKKRLSGMFKTAAAAVLGTGLLLLFSCNQILIPSREKTAGSGTVLLSFGNGVEGARTLLPSEVSFELYKLTIKPVAPNTSSEVKKDIYPNKPAGPIALNPGTWKIHVDAYTDSGGSTKAAEGDSATFEVKANQATPVNIVLAAVITDSVVGTLSVAISDNSGKVLASGSFWIYKGADFNEEVTFSGYNFSNSKKVSFNSSGLDDDISLPAGQYRVAAEIFNKEGQRSYLNEVAYIYSNLTTKFVVDVGDLQFADVTVISGKVLYRENTVAQSGYTLEIYTNSGGSGSSLASITISSSGEQQYTLTIPRPDKDVSLYFFITNSKKNRFSADSIKLNAGQKSAGKDISLKSAIITLSGTIGAVKVGKEDDADNAVNAEDVSVYAYYDGYENLYKGTVTDGTWKIENIPIPTGFTGAFDIGVSAKNGSSKDVRKWGYSPTTTGIPLGTVFLTPITPTKSLSGKIGTVTVAGGGTPDVGVYAYSSDDSYEVSINDDDDTWQASIPEDFTGTITIGVSANYEGLTGRKDVEKWTSGSTATDISLGDVSFSTLSGTIGAVTVDGDTPSNVSVYAGDLYYSRDELRRGEVSGDVRHGAWKILVPSDYSGSIVVRTDYKDGWYYSREAETWSPGSSTTDIDLKGVSFVTLSGTIGAVTVNGNIPDDLSVYARTSTTTSYKGSVQNGVWRIGIPADFDGTLFIGLAIHYGGGLHIQDNIAAWTSGSSPTGIRLDTRNLSVKPIKGTVTTNGSSPLNKGILAVFSASAPPTSVSSLINSHALGVVPEITNGSFSGNVQSDSSGYVVVAVPESNGGYSYYITPTRVSLTTNMSLTAAAMIELVN